MIEKLKYNERQIGGEDMVLRTEQIPAQPWEIQDKINELIDAVNELQTKVEIVEEHLHPTAKTDPYAEQRKWIGKLCKFWNLTEDDGEFDILISIDEESKGLPFVSYYLRKYACCEPVKPDDDIIFKESAPTDNDLRNMMKDPKYWRDKDPETIRRVEEGFKKLYGDKGE